METLPLKNKLYVCMYARVCMCVFVRVYVCVYDNDQRDDGGTAV
jgi:hypothetical protein